MSILENIKSFSYLSWLSWLWRWIKRKADRCLGSYPEQLIWRYRPKKWAHENLSSESLKHPVRGYLVTELDSFGSFESALEIGCGAGVNLITLKQHSPSLTLEGLDINRNAIQYGIEYISKHNIKDLVLTKGSAADLSRFPDKSFDLVFTNACFIHIGPERIKQILQDLVRISKIGICLNEFCSTAEGEFLYDDRWIYNWENLFSQFQGLEVVTKRMPTDIYGNPWNEYGYTIKISHINRDAIHRD